MKAVWYILFTQIGAFLQSSETVVLNLRYNTQNISSIEKKIAQGFSHFDTIHF